MRSEATCIVALRNYFEQGLTEVIPAIRINGDLKHRLPDNSSITLPGINAKQLLRRCQGLALSTGSACSCRNGGMSHVLKAIGLSPWAIQCTIRVGLGRFNRRFELEQAAATISKAVGMTVGIRSVQSRSPIPQLFEINTRNRLT
jgi:cysteine desulfurase